MKCCSLPEELTLVQQDCSPTFPDRMIIGDFICEKDCNIHFNITRSLQWTWTDPTMLKQPVKTTKDVLIPIPEMPDKLIGIFRTFLKSRTTIDWSWESTKMQNLSEDRSMSVEVTGGRKTQLWQPVGRCGWLTLSAGCILKRDHGHNTVQTICYPSGQASVRFGSGRSTGVLKILLQSITLLLFV